MRNTIQVPVEKSKFLNPQVVHDILDPTERFLYALRTCCGLDIKLIYTQISPLKNVKLSIEQSLPMRQVPLTKYP